MNESQDLSQLEESFGTSHVLVPLEETFDNTSPVLVPLDDEQDDMFMENIEIFNSTDEDVNPDPLDFSDNEAIPLDLDVEHDNPEDGYGGRGEPEIVQINLIEGDVIEFSYSEKLYSGMVEKVSKKDNKLVIRHLDQKKFSQLHLYDQTVLETPPNWVILKNELRSESITNFGSLHELQTISFCGVDIDSKGNSIVRRGIVRKIFTQSKKIKIYRLSGPAQPKNDSENKDCKEELPGYFNLGECEEI